MSRASVKKVIRSFPILLLLVVAGLAYMYTRPSNICPMGTNALGQAPYIIQGNIVCELVGINPNDNPLHYSSKYVSVPGRDVKSFQIVFGANSYLSIYSKDKNGVYFADKKIEGADPETFIVLTSTSTPSGSADANVAVFHYYSKDKNHVFFVGWDEIKTISDDPQHFVTLPDLYAVDSKNVFSMGKVLEGADPKTFQVLVNAPFCYGTDIYVKDNTNVFFHDKKILGSDAKTFAFLGYRFGRDALHTYKDGQIYNGDVAPSVADCEYGNDNGGQ